MTVTLDHVTRTVDGVPTIRDVSLTLEQRHPERAARPDAVGQDLADAPDGRPRPRRPSGRVLVDGKDVTGIDVRKRSVAMVYQQFINYPSMHRLREHRLAAARAGPAATRRSSGASREAARLLRLEPYLERMPLQLSGGQQQRTAIARALVKGADLVLLDEPLANLDYKLREELRDELPRIFEASGAIFVYATTEPSEALLLGGRTICLSEGQRRCRSATPPRSTAGRTPCAWRRLFSDPPLNIVGIEKKNGAVQLCRRRARRRPAGSMPGSRDGAYRVGFRAHQLDLANGIAGRHAFPATVTRDRNHRLGKLRASQARRRRTGSRVLHGVHEFPARRRARRRARSRRHLRVRRGRPAGRRAAARREGHAAWPASTSSISRTPTAATPPIAEAYALKPITMTWRQGGAYALLGPSGCGKTTLLNIISGIVTPSRGKILFDGVDVTPLSTQKRNIAQVFQFPVIYDTMTVGQNLAFPLKNRGVPRERDRGAGRRDRASCST